MPDPMTLRDAEHVLRGMKRNDRQAIALQTVLDAGHASTELRARVEKLEKGRVALLIQCRKEDLAEQRLGEEGTAILHTNTIRLLLDGEPDPDDAAEYDEDHQNELAARDLRAAGFTLPGQDDQR